MRILSRDSLPCSHPIGWRGTAYACPARPGVPGLVAARTRLGTSGRQWCLLIPETNHDQELYIDDLQCLKLDQLARPETSENWFSLVKVCVQYACQTCEKLTILIISQSNCVGWVSGNSTGGLKFHLVKDHSYDSPSAGWAKTWTLASLTPYLIPPSEGVLRKCILDSRDNEHLSPISI